MPPQLAVSGPASEDGFLLPLRETTIPQILWSTVNESAEQDCACPDDGLTPLVLTLPNDELAENDCACPDDGRPARSPGRQPRPAGVWKQAAHLYRTPLSPTHELVFNPLKGTSVAVLNAPAQRVLDAFARPLPLARLGDRVTEIAETQLTPTSQTLARLGLIQPVGEVPLSVRSQPHTLTAWLHVTNACNLRCTYCYLDHSAEAMDEATGLAAVEAVFRSAQSHGFHAVKLKYAGGEPTLNFRTVLKMHQRARELEAESNLELHEVILSNGVGLTPARLDAIRQADMRLMISVDGIGAAHDAQRTFKNGRGSYHRVARAIENARVCGLAPHLSITVTSHNIDHLPELVAFALERELPFNLNLFRDNEYAIPQAGLSVDHARLVEGMLAALAVVESRLPRQSLIGNVLDRTSLYQPHEYTCGVGRNYLVIDQSGRVARCQMEIRRTVGDIGQGDPLEAVRRHASDFDNLPVDAKAGCRACQWKYFCSGGCPRLAQTAAWRSDVPSPYCGVYRALIPRLLQLEGLRLLKYGLSA